MSDINEVMNQVSSSSKLQTDSAEKSSEKLNSLADMIGESIIKAQHVNDYLKQIPCLLLQLLPLRYSHLELINLFGLQSFQSW